MQAHFLSLSLDLSFFPLSSLSIFAFWFLPFLRVVLCHLPHFCSCFWNNSFRCEGHVISRPAPLSFSFFFSVSFRSYRIYTCLFLYVYIYLSCCLIFFFYALLPFPRYFSFHFEVPLNIQAARFGVRIRKYFLVLLGLSIRVQYCVCWHVFACDLRWRCHCKGATRSVKMLRQDCSHVNANAVDEFRRHRDFQVKKLALLFFYSFLFRHTSTLENWVKFRAIVGFENRVWFLYHKTAVAFFWGAGGVFTCFTLFIGRWKSTFLLRDVFIGSSVRLAILHYILRPYASSEILDYFLSLLHLAHWQDCCNLGFLLDKFHNLAIF